jgi:hypothetical protein
MAAAELGPDDRPASWRVSAFAERRVTHLTQILKVAAGAHITQVTPLGAVEVLACQRSELTVMIAAKDAAMIRVQRSKD